MAVQPRIISVRRRELLFLAQTTLVAARRTDSR
jgi:hypothetical protein